MKVSLNLAQWHSNVDLKKISVDETLQKIGAQLGAVEEVVYWGPRYDKIVVAKVKSCIQHPNADKLHVCRIDDGGVTADVARDEKGYVEVVCGAPNVREDLTVAWLPPGSTVPSSFGKDPFVLGSRELRGVVSNGMLGSSKELGIGDDHNGILEITAEDVGEELMRPGTPFKKLFGLDDVVIDCENKMFTHRPDCFGTLGVARELAGIQQKKFKSPDWYNLEPQYVAQPSDSIKGFTVKNEVPELVPRYMLMAVDNVKVATSPIWLQAYLSRVGIRPINNIVDMTNYMMMLTGQPLHAFDFDKIAVDGQVQIVVRKPEQGETITLLDGKTITPRKDAVLICDQDKPIALGGVMGGNNSEIDENTKRILIEAATFDMYNIRRTSMEHGIFTDAVTRFTKGQSPWQCAAVLAKAVGMITDELSPGAKPTGKVADTNHIKSENQDIVVGADFINSRLGSKLSLKDIATLLENVEFRITNVPADKDHLHITAPFWRVDIEQPEDIVEEVGRLYGYDQLPVVLPARSAQATLKDEALSLKHEIRSILAAAGANEVLTYSFVHGNLLEKVGQPASEAYALRNALSPDLQYYRLSLTPSLLDKVNMNLRAGYDEFALFELNKAHVRSHGQTDENVPDELDRLCLVYAANDRKSSDGAAYFEARKYLDFLASKLGLKLSYEKMVKDSEDPMAKPFDWQRSAVVKNSETGEVIGQIGEYRNEVRKSLKLPAHSAGFELDLDILASSRKPVNYQASSRFPSQAQDMTLEVAGTVSYSDLTQALANTIELASKDHGYMLSFVPLNIYSPEAKTTRYSYRITIGHLERTLTTIEVNEMLDAVAKQLMQDIKAERI